MDARQALLMREQMAHRGAVEQYAQLPQEKPRVHFPWGIVAGLIILILAYYFVTKFVLG